MTKQLDGTVALVTGAGIGIGIGTATAEALAALGATVARAAVEQTGRRRVQRGAAAADIAETITFVVTRPRHMSVNEVLLRPTEQDN